MGDEEIRQGRDRECGNHADRRPSGGTLPICSHFRNILGVYSLNFAFALEDENFHSPNEFFRLESFRRGQRAYVMLMEKLAERGL